MQWESKEGGAHVASSHIFQIDTEMSLGFLQIVLFERTNCQKEIWISPKSTSLRMGYSFVFKRSKQLYVGAEVI